MSLPTRYPVDAFFSDPVCSGATISPDGTRIAYLAPENLLKESEGHGFLNAESNINAFRAIERFLARTIGGEEVA